MPWSQVLLGGKPADVYEPPSRARFGVLDLHPFGLETLRDNVAFTRWFDTFSLACICPHGGRSWWADRLCSEFDAAITPERHLLTVVLPAFEERWELRPRAIGVTGISMGGQGALRLAFKYPDRFPVAAGIASAFEYHECYGEGTCLDAMYTSKEQCRQDTAIMHVPPHRSPPHLFFCCDPDDERWHRGNDRLHEKLNALGVAHTADLTTRGGGHTWAYFNTMAERTLRFVHEGLVQESRRLL